MSPRCSRDMSPRCSLLIEDPIVGTMKSSEILPLLSRNGRGLTICSPALSVTAIRSLAVHSGITPAINNKPGTGHQQREIRPRKSRQVTRIKIQDKDSRAETRDLIANVQLRYLRESRYSLLAGMSQESSRCCARMLAESVRKMALA